MVLQFVELTRRVNEERVNRAAKTGGKAEEFNWKHNALRHSFISYRVAQTQNVAQVALEAGNTPQMIFQHYRELVRQTEAKKWFSLVPSVGGKLISLAESKTQKPEAARQKAARV
jgi:hypothetical protein